MKQSLKGVIQGVRNDSFSEILRTYLMDGPKDGFTYFYEAECQDKPQTQTFASCYVKEHY